MKLQWVLFLVGITVHSGYFVSSLSVINYGDLQISMVQHGEKYATNRPCYALEDVQPKYHGMAHLRGENDKVGTVSFEVDVPVHVYLAVDSRYSYIHGVLFESTNERIMLGGCHARTPFYIYKSKKPYQPGLVQINFPSSRMTAIFIRDSRLIQEDAELKIKPPPHAELSMAREGEKFATNRDCYTMVDIPPNLYGLTHIRLLNDESYVEFAVNVPVNVYVAMDSRYENILSKLFVKTDQKIVHAGCHPRVDFPVYKQFFNPQVIKIKLKETRMFAVFVEPVADNTFKSGVYA